MKLRLMRF